MKKTNKVKIFAGICILISIISLFLILTFSEKSIEYVDISKEIQCSSLKYDFDTKILLQEKFGELECQYINKNLEIDFSKHALITMTINAGCKDIKEDFSIEFKESNQENSVYYKIIEKPGPRCEIIDIKTKYMLIDKKYNQYEFIENN